MKEFPHDGVYTRIMPSPIHGVGVFAIRKITVGSYIFHGDNSKMVWIDKADIVDLEPELKRLYDDFCIIEADQYLCPDNFNNLNVGWYLNECKENPNVGCDANYDFYALRDIEPGEELTLDYGRFSDYPEE